MKRFIIYLLFSILTVCFISTSIYASTFFVEIRVVNTTANTYNYYPISSSINNSGLVSTGFISTDGLDIRVKDSNSISLPIMNTTHNILFVPSLVSPNSNSSYIWSVGNPKHIPGDANEDGVIDSLDLAYLERILNNSIPATTSSDTDLNGTVTIADLEMTDAIINGYLPTPTKFDPIIVSSTGGYIFVGDNPITEPAFAINPIWDIKINGYFNTTAGGGKYIIDKAAELSLFVSSTVSGTITADFAGQQLSFTGISSGIHTIEIYCDGTNYGMIIDIDKYNVHIEDYILNYQDVSTVTYYMSYNNGVVVPTNYTMRMCDFDNNGIVTVADRTILQNMIISNQRSVAISTQITNTVNSWYLFENNSTSYVNYYIEEVNYIEVQKYSPTTILSDSTTTITTGGGSGTINLTTSSRTVTGNSTNFTPYMIGGQIKGDIDGVYYSIESVQSTTSLTIITEYLETGGNILDYTLNYYPTAILIDLDGTQNGVITLGHNPTGATYVSAVIGQLTGTSSSSLNTNVISEANMPSGWFGLGAGSVNLPFYGDGTTWGFSKVASEIGWTVQSLYLVMMLATVSAVMFGVALFTGSTALTLGAGAITLGMAVSTTVASGWMVFVFLILGVGIWYLSRQG
jgi:hypothetical protein